MKQDDESLLGVGAGRVVTLQPNTVVELQQLTDRSRAQTPNPTVPVTRAQRQAAHYGLGVAPSQQWRRAQHRLPCGRRAHAGYHRLSPPTLLGPDRDIT